VHSGTVLSKAMWKWGPWRLCFSFADHYCEIKIDLTGMIVLLLRLNSRLMGLSFYMHLTDHYALIWLITLIALIVFETFMRVFVLIGWSDWCMQVAVNASGLGILYLVFKSQINKTPANGYWQHRTSIAAAAAAVGVIENTSRMIDLWSLRRQVKCYTELITSMRCVRPLHARLTAIKSWYDYSPLDDVSYCNKCTQSRKPHDSAWLIQTRSYVF